MNNFLYTENEEKLLTLVNKYTIDDLKSFSVCREIAEVTEEVLNELLSEFCNVIVSVDTETNVFTIHLSGTKPLYLFLRKENPELLKEILKLIISHYGLNKVINIDGTGSGRPCVIFLD